MYKDKNIFTHTGIVNTVGNRKRQLLRQTKYYWVCVSTSSEWAPFRFRKTDGDASSQDVQGMACLELGTIRKLKKSRRA